MQAPQNKGHTVPNRQLPGRRGSKNHRRPQRGSSDTSSQADASAKPQLRLAASDGKLLVSSTLEVSSFPKLDFSLVVVWGEEGWMLYKQLLVTFVSSSSCLLFHSSYVFNGKLSLKKKKKSIPLEMMTLRLRDPVQQRPPRAQCRQEDGGCSRRRTLPSPSCTLPAPRGRGKSQAITFTLLLAPLPGQRGYQAIAPRYSREPGAGQRHPTAPHPRAPNSSPRSQHSHFRETKL